ncbi:MAG: HAMP domain-containing protein [Proteobacteria bacterium]|nr:HAMP domain-containing protein [Pseudomonadota bacterium]
MDIRTKLVFALVAASLGSMLALGAFAYGAARDLLRDVALRQLEAVVDTKKENLERAVVAWRDRVQLITSRTQLRESLETFRHSPDDETLESIEESLQDAIESVQSLRGIAVFSAFGKPVASIGIVPGADAPVRPVTFMWAEEPVMYEDVFLDPAGALLITFISPIRLRGQLLGAAKVALRADELIDVTDDYTGLGETGETLIAQLDDDGNAVILNPLRHDPGASMIRRVSAEHTEDPTLQAALGNEDTFESGAVDYRGQEVWAATRFLEEFGWGLVVKVDTAEETRPVIEFRNTLAKLALSLSAFAIVGGIGFGIYFARPIRELADVARRIRQGELDLRAKTGTDDEVGLLAETFNQMTEELVRSNRTLEQQIRDGNRTGSATGGGGTGS